jgi:hypothetical protein
VGVLTICTGCQQFRPAGAPGCVDCDLEAFAGATSFAEITRRVRGAVRVM